MKKRNFNKHISKILVIGFLGIIAIGIVVLQVAMTDEKTTKFDVALLNIIQFIFSVLFSWFLAKNSFQIDFERNQKKFAIAAYRRITELDKRVTALAEKIQSKIKLNSAAGTGDFEILLAITDGIKQNIGSSIADWGDIIGDEIETLEELNKILKERERILTLQVSKESGTDFNDNTINEKVAVLEEYNQKILSLMSNLPETIKIQMKEQRKQEAKRDEEDQINENIRKFYELKNEMGYTTLSGFWSTAERYNMKRSILDFKRGDRLKIEILGNPNDKGPVNLIDGNNEMVGRVTNPFTTSYSSFSNALRVIIGKTVSEVELLDIDESGVGNRHHFALKVLE
ncbi:hypothetical protein AB4114_17700 [Paenibacillus sp. 2RAB27]|uniref:hypothetical protein n=1 Tax=Paenibacillus sp. 2RAB27 TaxID=3232991 RepID=UPI003F9AC8F2